ncbi:MAG TPA: NUDIX hydrolase [Steroidobacteraceae bacterium]|jgi:ADP-ribose pyrophosphatase YjhB (NUDIX family)
MLQCLEMQDLRWLHWAQQLQAVAQTGEAYATNEFDRQRYDLVRNIAAAMLAAGSAAEPEALIELFGREGGYATPKIDVRAAVFRDDRILMVQERSDGRWTLPGGFADVGDSPSAAVEREVREESGFIVKASKLVALFDRNRHPHPPFGYHLWKAFFLCELQGGEAQASIETSAVGFFGQGELPPLSQGRITLGQVQYMFEQQRHPLLPASFD